MSQYSFLHSSSVITESVITAIKIKLPGIGEYLDQRLVASVHLPAPTQHGLIMSWGRYLMMEYCHTEDKYAEEGEEGDERKWLHVCYKSMEAQLWDDKKLI
jgi:hypothetical protein